MDLIQLGNVIPIAQMVIILILKAKLVYLLAQICILLLKIQEQEDVLKIVLQINMLIMLQILVLLHVLLILMVITQDGFVFHFAYHLHMQDKL